MTRPTKACTEPEQAHQREHNGQEVDKAAMVADCASRSASHSSSELDEDSVARGASGAGAVGTEDPEATVEAAWRARATRERRSWGGGTGGQLLVAKPVTSPDSARATEPRRPEATLELRRGARGARFGRGAGERERVRVRGEEALSDAERNREAATSRLDEGAGADTAGPELQEPEASLRLEKQHRNLDWQAP